MAALVELKARLPTPDLQFTWAQAPVRLEDALGRIIPVASEYDWEVCIHVYLLFARMVTHPADLESRSHCSYSVQ